MSSITEKITKAIKEKRLLKAMIKAIKSRSTQTTKEWVFISLSQISFLFNGKLKQAYKKYIQSIYDENITWAINRAVHEKAADQVVKNFILAKNENVKEIYKPGVMWANILKEVKTYAKWQQTNDDKTLTDALYEFYRTDLIFAFAGDAYIWQYKIDTFDKKLQAYMIIKRYEDFINQKLPFSKDLIYTTDIGKNVYIEWDNKKISYKVIRDAYYMNRMIDSGLMNSPKPIIAELGAGAGELAIFSKKALPNCTYVCFDLPSTLMVSSYNIKMTFSDLKIGLYEDFRNIQKITRKEIERFDIVMLPNWCLEVVEQDLFDVFINIGSLSEMDREMVKNYIQLIEKTTRGYFYTVNRNISVKEFGAEDIPLCEFPFSNGTKIISQRYDPASDLFHGHYGIYTANYSEFILKCREGKPVTPVPAAASDLHHGAARAGR